MKLDRIDLKILQQLQLNARVTNVQLADAVGLSASPCLTRVKRLEDAGIIVGYQAELDLAKIADYVTAYAEVTLRNHRRDEALRFERAVCRITEVVEFHMVHGKYDYLMKIVAPGYEGPANVMEEIWNADLGVQNYSVLVVTSTPITNPSLSIMI